MSKHIKALVVLNLQSYAGGRDLWGLRDPKRDAAKGWQTPIFNDGLIEVCSLACSAEPVTLHMQATMHAEPCMTGCKSLCNQKRAEDHLPFWPKRGP